MEFEYVNEYLIVLVEDMKEFGLFGVFIDFEYGGFGFIVLIYLKIVMLILEEWMSLFGIFNLYLMMVLIVQKFGMDKQKEYWLLKFVIGEICGGLVLIELNVGIDLQVFIIKVMCKGDKYVVEGVKIWIFNLIEGQCVVLLCKIDLSVQLCYKGMLMLIMQIKNLEIM